MLSAVRVRLGSLMKLWLALTAMSILVPVGCARCGIAQDQGVRGREKIVAHGTHRTPRTGRKILKQKAATSVSLVVVSSPPNCSVTIDGGAPEETDTRGELELTVSPGSHVIRVNRDGYVTREADVEIAPTSAEQQVEFTLSPSLLSLNVVTDPPSTEVYLDEVYKGSTNANGLLVIERINPTQPHSVRVHKDGFTRQAAVPVTTYSGQISFKLVRDSITLKVLTDPAEAEVYLDDVYKGTSTAEGLLLIEQVNVNQSHRLRAVKREGFLQRSVVLQANQSEASIKLPPDPIVLLIKSIKQQVAEGHLTEAFAGYTQLSADASEHPELPRLLETILQNVQLRSTETLKKTSFFGLALELKEARELEHLYEPGHKWKPGDETLGNLGKYWELKTALIMATESPSPETDNARRKARMILVELADRSLNNHLLLLDLGWAWWQLNERANAEKYFDGAQKLRPEWPYPYFARGFLAMTGADNERNKASRTSRYMQAIAGFDKAIELKHDFARAYALRGFSYAQIKQPDQAVGNGLQAVALDPQSSYAHFSLAFAYFQKGKSSYRNSQSEITRALAANVVELDEAAKNTIQQMLVQIRRVLK